MTSLLVTAFLLGLGAGGFLGLALADAEASFRPFTPTARDPLPAPPATPDPAYPDPLALPTARERIRGVRLVLPDRPTDPSPRDPVGPLRPAFPVTG